MNGSPHEGRNRRSARWGFWAAAAVLAGVSYLLMPLRPGGEPDRGISGDPADLQPAGNAPALPGAGTSSGREPSLPRTSEAAASAAGISTVATGLFNRNLPLITLQGAVISADDGRPIPHARISITVPAEPPIGIGTGVNPQGAFQVAVPQGHRYEIRVEAEGFKVYAGTHLMIARDSHTLEIRMEPAFEVRGRVLDGSANGISGARVWWAAGGARHYDAATETDSLGRFSLRDLPGTGQILIEAAHPAYRQASQVTAEVPAREESLVRMASVSGTGSVFGVVTDPDGAALSGARVSLVDSNRNLSLVLSQAFTDPKGAYHFEEVQEGRYWVVFGQWTSYANYQGNLREVAVQAGRDFRVDFTLDPGESIRGFVFNERNVPVDGARILFTPADAHVPAQETTGPDGGFRTDCLLRTPYTLTVSHPDYADLHIEGVMPSEQPLRLTLSEGLVLRGTISDAKGSSINRIALQLLSAAAGMTNRFMDLSIADGRFEIRGLTPGPYEIMLSTGQGRWASASLLLSRSADVMLIYDAVLSRLTMQSIR